MAAELPQPPSQESTRSSWLTRAEKYALWQQTLLATLPQPSGPRSFAVENELRATVRSGRSTHGGANVFRQASSLGNTGPVARPAVHIWYRAETREETVERLRNERLLLSRRGAQWRL